MGEGVRYQVADLLVDAGRGRVSRGDTQIPLPKLSFDLLLVLIQESPNLLSIDTLIEKVWPGLVVSPETVSQRVKLVRDALGDDSKAPRYIGSLRSRGYQLLAPVQRLPNETALAAPTAAPQQSTTLVASDSAIAAAIEPPRPWLQSRAGKIGLAVGAVAVAALAILGIRQAMRPSAPKFSPPPHSVAVLAFVNMSGDQDVNYLSDGLAEQLSTDLARIDQLQVAARTSSFYFKGKDVDIHTVGQKLNVAAVLEGSVRVSGDRLRFTAQLIDAKTGFHLWAQTYDRTRRDLLSVQQEIATAVTGALKIKLLAGDDSKLAPGGTRNSDAYDAYLRGRHDETVEDEEHLRAALAAQDQAIAFDPQFADAYAARADVAMQVANMFTPDPKEHAQLNAQALADAKTAAALAPDSAWALSILGQGLAFVAADFHAADVAYKKSVELGPGNADILHSYASYAASFGRADAIRAAQRAVQLDPLGLGSYGNLGLTLFYAHRFDEAAVAFRESARLGYNHVNPSWQGLNELAAGRPQSALAPCESDKMFWYNQLCLALVYHKLGRQADAQGMLDKIRAAMGDELTFEYAEIYAYWGRPAEAMKQLRRAVDVKDSGLLSLKTDPFLESLHADPEFQSILAKLDLPT